MSDDIVEAIDNALDDWDVSPDAVRWTPEKAPEVAPRSERYLTARAFTAEHRRALGDILVSLNMTALSAADDPTVVDWSQVEPLAADDALAEDA